MDFSTTARASAAPVSTKGSSDFWSIPLLCLGIAIVACCVLMPMTEANRRVAWQREKLKRDLAHLQEQVRVNDDFLKRIPGDPALAERLAQRQMRLIREGSSVLNLKAEPNMQSSPFLLVSVQQPMVMAAYQSTPGRLGKIASDAKFQLYLLGGALLLVAMGLLWDSPSAQTYARPPQD